MNIQFSSLIFTCLVSSHLCMPTDNGSGNDLLAAIQDHQLPEPKGNVPKVIDHSRGVYMHAHDFAHLSGAPRSAFHAQYNHATGGIGKGDRKRSLSDKMMKMFNIKLRLR